MVLFEGEDANPTNPTNRFWLHIKAVILRVLLRIGMLLHGYPFPIPPRPSFIRTIEPRSICSGRVKLRFYTPKTYHKTKKAGHKYPVVVNFHGGGFCIGKATDDSRWAKTVVDTCDAVVVGVDYRLAPEHPFPAAVDDGVDTLLYLESHALELGLDIRRISLTGFSAGGNLVFAVPLRLHFRSHLDSELSSSESLNSIPPLHRSHSTDVLLRVPSGPQPPINTNIRIVCLCSWYPILDFVLSRDIRRERSILPEKALPPFLTSLFDESYVPNRSDRYSPFASPYRASDDMLRDALPKDIFMYMCEWDMLLQEGQEFVHRLEKGGKKVRSMMIEQSMHGWDKSPNPFRDQRHVDVLYQAACEGMRSVFEHGVQQQQNVTFLT
ncbi:hypothetical protein AJ80_10011 [Polytolypa hystricis UAMH7299]|uniref:Alpha/beta hydrolase fold-3 domain-containing protein n=1 Tax=Polytolypa hystricis (strain UAMH7299) TaxID=1447883 RepID=A0A2B7WEZ6_POLH7|nr:hypothetical protein AJ80_10011 [Polytolypa hystricis UAMH7299]